MSNKCPNCGAPIINGRCEYCGTVFDRHGTATLSTDEIDTREAIEITTLEDLRPCYVTRDGRVVRDVRQKSV